MTGNCCMWHYKSSASSTQASISLCLSHLPSQLKMNLCEILGHLCSLLNHLLDGSNHVESLLGQGIVLTWRERMNIRSNQNGTPTTPRKVISLKIDWSVATSRTADIAISEMQDYAHGLDCYVGATAPKQPSLTSCFNTLSCRNWPTKLLTSHTYIISQSPSLNLITSTTYHLECSGSHWWSPWVAPACQRDQWRLLPPGRAGTRNAGSCGHETQSACPPQTTHPYPGLQWYPAGTYSPEGRVVGIMLRARSVIHY